VLKEESKLCDQSLTVFLFCLCSAYDHFDAGLPEDESGVIGRRR
jgi:hypothetical protein